MVKVIDRLDQTLLDVPLPNHKQMPHGRITSAEPVIGKLVAQLSGFIKRFRTRKPQHAPGVSVNNWNVRVGNYLMYSQVHSLTDRHREILSLVAEGMTNKEIGYRLNISDQTVKNHMVNIMNKLDANDRTHAVVLAYRIGLLDLRVAVG